MKSDDITEYLDKCTAHGIPHLRTANRGHRVVWALVIIFATTAFTFHVFILLRKYFTYNVITQWSSDVDIVPQFPTVTLCDASPLSHARTHNGSIIHGNAAVSKHDLILHRVQDIWRVVLSKDLADLGKYDRSWNLLSRKTLQQYSVNHNLAHRKEDAIVQCIYFGLPCTIDSFTEVWLPFYHYCFQFEPKIDTSYWQGESDGLNLILFAHDRNGILTDAERLKWLSGFYVILSQKGHLPVASDMVQAAVGSHASLTFKQTNYKRSKQGDDSCTDAERAINLTFHDEYGVHAEPKQYQYDRRVCMVDQHQKLFFKKCGCYNDLHLIPADVDSMGKWCHYVAPEYLVHDGFQLVNATHVKFNKNILVLNNTVFKNFKRRHECLVELDKSIDERRIPKPTCLRSCSRVKYSVYTNNMRWPTRLDYGNNIEFAINKSLNVSRARGLDSVLENLLDPSHKHSQWYSTLDSVRQSFLMLSIYTKTKDVLVSEEQLVYPLGNLLSDFGGSLGLWIGCSIISIIELLWFCASCFRRWLKPQRPLNQDIAVWSGCDKVGHLDQFHV